MPPDNDGPITRADLVHLRSDILDGMREMETRLLRAFFTYQEHADVKFRKLSADVSNIDRSTELRLEHLEQRMVEIEKRLMLGGSPPPQL